MDALCVQSGYHEIPRSIAQKVIIITRQQAYVGFTWWYIQPAGLLLEHPGWWICDLHQFIGDRLESRTRWAMERPDQLARPRAAGA
jgi:hypothetical protein